MLVNIAAVLVILVLAPPIVRPIVSSIFSGLGDLASSLSTPVTNERERVAKEGSQAFLFLVVTAAVVVATWVVFF